MRRSTDVVCPSCGDWTVDEKWAEETKLTNADGTIEILPGEWIAECFSCGWREDDLDDVVAFGFPTPE